MTKGSVPAIAAAELRHQLRTPLNHVIGYSEILLEDHRQPDIAIRFETILAEANAMLEAIQQEAPGDHPNVSPAVLGALNERMARGIERVSRIVADLRTSLPPSTHTDLNRIAVAIASLPEILGGALQETPAQAPRMEARPEVFGGPGRILIVDDNEVNRDMLSRQLEPQQHEVETAPDGETALRMLRGQRFDLLVLDLMMPGMNGFEVLEAVKRDPSLSGVAVILVSALDDMDGVVRSIEAGAEDYLFKPVNPTLLRARIKSTLDKVRAEEAIRRKQRLESIGLLASGIAHDFNNLLTGIIGHAQMLEQALISSEDRAMAESIVKSGERAAELTRQLLAYSGKAFPMMQPVDLAALLHDTEALIRASLPRRTRLQTSLSRASLVTADPNQIRQVLLNLVLNAAEAIGTEAPGTLTIETGSEFIEQGPLFDVMEEEVRPGTYSWIEVRDTGCGMDAATVAKIFEPFFTTKFLGRGLGLAAVAGIVRSHKGLLRVRSAPGEGSAFRVYLPVAAPASEAADPLPETQLSILVVDDEPVVRQIVKVALERSGRKVLMAHTGEAAVAEMSAHADQIGLVLLDWKMPGMDGAETLARLLRIKPSLKVILSSGFSQAEAEESFRYSSIVDYLQKPYRMSELARVVEKALPQAGPTY
jgi:DNA-binding response OmpR family regulator